MGGVLREILSGLVSPPLVAKMLIGTGTRLRPKGTTPRRCLGTKLGAVGKGLWSPPKAQNIKEGIYTYNIEFVVAWAHLLVSFAIFDPRGNHNIQRSE